MIKSSIDTPSRSRGGDFFKTKNAYLRLNDGAVFRGQTPSWQRGFYDGEVVFNTGMTGYVESLTDPSYKNQILVFSYPLIGNYGVQKVHQESKRIQVSGVIVSQLALNYSHSQADTSLLSWLHSQQIPVLSGCDTRALTKHLRVNGSMLGYIGTGTPVNRLVKMKHAPSSERGTASQNANYSKKIILVDCGAKENILRSLLELPANIVTVSHDYDYSNDEYDAVLISNGPGDPTMYKDTIEILKKVLKNPKPIFGICLGSQLMALAAGAKTYKLKFGHRGHNQPCIETGTKKCVITSQNHSFAVDEKTMPPDWSVSFRNLNDGSIEGIKHDTKPFFSVQFHPEACPGPTDTQWLFDKFYQII